MSSLSFRERAAIAFAVEAAKLPIHGAANTSVDEMNRAVSIAALHFSETLAAEACSRWGHVGDGDTCGRCGAATGAKTARFEAAKERTLEFLKNSKERSFTEIYVMSKGVGQRTLDSVLRMLERDGKITKRMNGRQSLWSAVSS